MLNPLEVPTFAVVGHPNKGKSSIVSALTQHEEVTIAPLPGTTKKHRSYALSVDGKPLLQLVDTPGFQRPRAVMERLLTYDEATRSRRQAIERFVAEHRDDAYFADEIELLTPIVEGAGMMYVVDASKPYASEFETEMEILRWCGQPSLAVINRIKDEDYTEQWREALQSHFNIVRTYDPMHATLRDHLRLIESMAHTDERWLDALKAAASHLKEDFTRRVRASAQTIVAGLETMVRHKESMTIQKSKATPEEKETLLHRYQEALRQQERSVYKRLQAVWRHERKGIHVALSYDDAPDLFAQESASVFGLDKKDLIVAGALGGAASGAGIDLMFVGHTLFAGGVIGALTGAAGAYLAFDRLAKISVLGIAAGRYELVMGPMKDAQFFSVAAGRLVYFAYRLASLSHAYRDDVTIEPDEAFLQMWFDRSHTAALTKAFAALRKGKRDDAAVGVWEKSIETMIAQAGE